VFKSRLVLIEVVSFQVKDGIVPQGGGGGFILLSSTSFQFIIHPVIRAFIIRAADSVCT